MTTDYNTHIHAQPQSKLGYATSNLTPKDELLLYNLLQFYNKNNNIDKLLEIIAGKSKISLRIIDWFVTNYAKKNDICYLNNSGLHFCVYSSYKNHLKSFGKKNFDPFCRENNKNIHRNNKIQLPYNNVSAIETTIGQLNFFKWMFNENILTYIIDNYEDIENDMKIRGSISKKKQQNSTDLSRVSAATVPPLTLGNNNIKKTRKRREELSISATKNIKKINVEVVLKFNSVSPPTTSSS